MSRRCDKKDPAKNQRDRPTIHGALLLILLAVASPAFSTTVNGPATVDGPCATAVPLPTNTFVEDGGGLYQLRIDQPGVLGLHAAAPIDAPTRIRLTLLAPDCLAPAIDTGYVRVRETPRGLMLRILEPTSLYIRVSAEDPDAPLVTSTLRATFVPRLAWVKDVDPWEEEETSGLMVECPTTNDSELDDDFTLCTTGKNDRPICGTPLAPGDLELGVIDGATDDDYYTFTLDTQATMAIEIDGHTGIRGALYNNAGQRLETWAGRLVRTLGAGRFHVRVGSIDGWGDYVVGVGLIP